MRLLNTQFVAAHGDLAGLKKAKARGLMAREVERVKLKLSANKETQGMIEA